MLGLTFDLGRPLTFAIALAGVVIGLLIASRSRKLAARDIARIALALVVVVASGEPLIRDPDPPRTRVLVADRSASFAEARASLRAELERSGRDLDPDRDRIAAITFGARPIVASEPRPAREAAIVAKAALEASVESAGSDLGAALDLALSVARSAGGLAEIVVITDGQDTGGRSREAAERIAAAGVVLHAVSPLIASPPNARVSRLDLPSRASPGEQIRVEVEVETTVRSAVDVSLELDKLEGIVEPRSQTVRVSAEPGAPARAVFRLRLAFEGTGTVRARATLLAANDAFPEDDALEASLMIGDKARAVLVIGPDSSPEPWRSLLEEAGLSVDVTAPANIADEALATGRSASIVVVDEVPASALSGEVATALERVHESGAGLIVAGCDRAFGPGGYPDSSVEKLLPVKSGPPGEPRKPLALELVIDASGSMNTSVDATHSTRFLTAIDACVPKGPGELRKGDLLGVVLFAEAPRVQIDLGPVTDAHTFATKLRGLTPSGGTNVAAGLIRGLEEIEKVPARRLLVLVTDGLNAQAPTKVPEVRAAAEKAFASKGELDVALILVGDEKAGEETVKTLAQAVDPTGKHARWDHVSEAKLGELVRGKLIPSSRNERREGSFSVFDAAGARVGSIESLAPIEPRPLSTVLLTAKEGDVPASPLAVAASGRGGACVALATGLATGGAALARSPLGRASLLQMIKSATRPGSGDVELRAVRRPGAIEVVAHTRDDRAGLFARAGGVASAPTRSAPLVPSAPGELRARISTAARESVLVTVVDPRGNTLAQTVVGSEAWLELAPPARDLALLGELASITGDDRGVAPELLNYPAPAHALRSSRALAPWLALLALGLLIAEGGVSVLLERLAARRAAGGLFRAVGPSSPERR